MYDHHFWVLTGVYLRSIFAQIEGAEFGMTVNKLNTSKMKNKVAKFEKSSTFVSLLLFNIPAEETRLNLTK